MGAQKNISLLLAAVAIAGIGWNTFIRISSLSEHPSCRAMLPMAHLERRRLKEKINNADLELATLTKQERPIKGRPISDDKKNAKDLPARIAALEAEQRKLKTDLNILIAQEQSPLSKDAAAAKQEGRTLYEETTILRKELRQLKNRLVRIDSLFCSLNTIFFKTLFIRSIGSYTCCTTLYNCLSISAYNN